MTWTDGDEIDPKEAKEHVKRVLADPKHKRPKGHADDELTRDDPITEEDA